MLSRGWMFYLFRYVFCAFPPFKTDWTFLVGGLGITQFLVKNVGLVAIYHVYLFFGSQIHHAPMMFEPWVSFGFCFQGGFLTFFNCWHISNYVIQYETLVEASDFWRMIPVAISYPSLCIQKNVILCIQFGINWLWLLHSAFHVRNSFVHFLTS